MKRIALLGSTGSVGRQCLEIIDVNNDLEVITLTANHNITLLEVQIRKYLPKKVCVMDAEAGEQLRTRISDLAVEVVTGMEGLIACATIEEVDIVCSAVVGMIGIRPTIEAIKAGKDIALANKETLVTAGHLIMPLAKEYQVSILPVDSEHSAIFQALNGEDTREVEKLILTASGGPFRGKDLTYLYNVSKEEALKHPSWNMGPKITIDSATLVNKGLEVIEARWLFDIPIEDIEVVVHPGSIIHSMVQFVDGAVMAQMGVPDMRLPIQYALLYPERRGFTKDRLDFSALGKLEFEKPDLQTFKGLSLAYEAGKMGGSMPTVFNAANECSVGLFLGDKIKFTDIVDNIELAMKEHNIIKSPSFEEILATEAWTYKLIESRC